MAETADALWLQLLSWLADQPRTYRETMDAWRTSCPRFPIWEDAVADGLVEVRGGATMQDADVLVTPRGLGLLEQRSVTLSDAVYTAPEGAGTEVS
jgi:hypothetical protein